MSTIDVAAELELGAKKIERDGWWDGTLDGPFGSATNPNSWCALLSINGRFWQPVARYFENFLGETVPSFNDAQPNPEAVVKVMREAAQVWRETNR